MKLENWTYMQVAKAHALNSYAVRKKVGAALITPSGVIVAGYNGTPRGCDNNCEIIVNGESVTKPDVIHAEKNVLIHAASQGVSICGGTMYITMSPCIPCAAMMLQAKIKQVFYEEEYRDKSAIEFLNMHGIPCTQLLKSGVDYE